jgi:hypothetical protein
VLGRIFRSDTQARSANLPYNLSRHGATRLIGAGGQPHGKERGIEVEAAGGDTTDEMRVVSGLSGGTLLEAA